MNPSKNFCTIGKIYMAEVFTLKPFGLKALLLLTLALGMPMASSLDSPSDAVTYSSEDASSFAEFFAMEPPATSGGVERYSTPGREPSSVTFGGRSTSYSAYQSTRGGTNALWIMGTSSWTQRVVAPLGSYLSLLASSSGGGRAEFYEIRPDGRLLSSSYTLYPGHNRLVFHADVVGRHVLLFVADGQPSNVVIVDVASGGWPPSPGPAPGPGPSPGYARVIFSSTWLKGYSVFVDGSYVGGDGQGGDPLDGTFSLNVPGDRYQVLQISGGGRTYSERGTFLSGYTYKLSI